MYLDEFFEKYFYNQENSFGFLTKSFLPPLIVILLNRLIILLIFVSTEIEQKVRKSKYHFTVQQLSFIYIIFNMLIVPGLAVPTGTNVYNLLAN